MSNLISVVQANRAAKAATAAEETRVLEANMDRYAKQEDRNLRRRRQDWLDDQAIKTQEIAGERLKIAQEAAQAKKEESALGNIDMVLQTPVKGYVKPGEPTPEMANAEAARQNADPKGQVVHYNAPGGFMSPDKRQVYRIPVGLKIKGVQITPPMLVERAKESGMTLNEFILKWRERY